VFHLLRKISPLFAAAVLFAGIAAPAQAANPPRPGNGSLVVYAGWLKGFADGHLAPLLKLAEAWSKGFADGH
jgi:hypothetical protein